VTSAARTRRSAIRDLLRSRPVSVDELAVRFEVTASTIRRDLAALTDGGEVVRTYGGALAAGPSEQSLYEREGLAAVEKAAIAREAERHVRAGQLLLLDAGTTVGALAERLTSWTDITVASTGLTAVNTLADCEGVDLICLGGSVRHISQGMVGPLAEAALSGLTADAVFLGADGVTAQRGVCEATPTQASLKRRMVAAAAAVYVLADASKLGRANSHWWTPLPAGWTLITDGSARDDQLAPFRRADMEIIVAR
jgi:DeoR/GlpR family transcriptional regulator of sugar metabolism